MMEMGEQYGLPDHRRHMPGKADIPAVPDASRQRSLMVVVGGGGELFVQSSPPPAPQPEGLDGDQGRWPRQETLTLLEIRTRLDSRFREASQKAHLWDELSRIMGEEYGFQRSGKKCREKLENLYKYYKKTKERQSGRRDGRHYRFFRQLEALYGENNNTPTSTKSCFHVASTSTAHHSYHPLISLSNLTEFDSSSTEEDGEDRSIAAVNDDDPRLQNVRDVVEREMRKFMDAQEAWLEKMLGALEHMEQERVSREAAWRREETARWDGEQRFWAGERAWIKARDAALIEALDNIAARKMNPLLPEEFTATDDGRDRRSEIESGTPDDSNLIGRGWLEPELTGLFELGEGEEEDQESILVALGPAMGAT